MQPTVGRVYLHQLDLHLTVLRGREARPVIWKQMSHGTSVKSNQDKVLPGPRYRRREYSPNLVDTQVGPGVLRRVDLSNRRNEAMSTVIRLFVIQQLRYPNL
jgi:hypothetical protein